jgi:tryptophanyl-tRNA synthetase
VSIALGVLTIVFAWRRSSDRATATWATFGFIVTYPITQAAAILYPGAAFFDPDFEKITPLGIPIQLWLGALQVSLAALATWLALRSKPASP